MRGMTNSIVQRDEVNVLIYYDFDLNDFVLMKVKESTQNVDSSFEGHIEEKIKHKVEEFIYTGRKVFFFMYFIYELLRQYAPLELKSVFL